MSQPSRAVEWLAMLLKIDYDYRVVDLRASEQHSDWFKALNPFGKVPVIQHGDKVIIESHAIMEYMVNTFGASSRVREAYLPNANKQFKQRYNEYLHWHHSNVRQPFATLVFFVCLGPILNLNISQAQLKQTHKEAMKALRMIERWLTKMVKSGQFLAGTNTPTIADLSCCCEFDQLFLLPKKYQPTDLQTKYPAFFKWYNLMTSLSGHAKVYQGMIDSGKALAKL